MAVAIAREIYVCNAVVGEVNALSSSDLTFTAALAFSFGFTDGELAQLRVVVRPYDTGFLTAERDDEENHYEIQIGVQQIVPRTNVLTITKVFNLLMAIGDLYPIDRPIVVQHRTMNVLNKRLFPMMVRSKDSGQTPGIMDGTSPNTRFDASWIVTFREVVNVAAIATAAVSLPPNSGGSSGGSSPSVAPTVTAAAGTILLVEA